MNRLIDDYLREVETSLRVDAARKRQIVDELRTHLAEKVEEVARAEPGRTIPEIEQEVLREFGNARDLALAYEPEGAIVLTNAAGDIVLRVDRAVGRGARVAGRGAGKALKWLAISLAALLVIALGAGAWAYYEIKPYIPAIIEQSEPTYQYFETCGPTPCSGEAAADVFYVRPESTSVRLNLNAYYAHDPDDWDERLGNGSVRVVVTDPEGTMRLDRTFDMSAEGRAYYETTWVSAPGNWSIAYTFDAFVGRIDVNAYAIGFPWASGE